MPSCLAVARTFGNGGAPGNGRVKIRLELAVKPDGPPRIVACLVAGAPRDDCDVQRLDARGAFRTQDRRHVKGAAAASASTHRMADPTPRFGHFSRPTIVRFQLT